MKEIREISEPTILFTWAPRSVDSLDFAPIRTDIEVTLIISWGSESVTRNLYSEFFNGFPFRRVTQRTAVDTFSESDPAYFKLDSLLGGLFLIQNLQLTRLISSLISMNVLVSDRATNELVLNIERQTTRINNFR